MAQALHECLSDNLRSYDDMYAEDEVEVLCPDLPKNPYDALDEIRKIVETERVDVIVGNSCGGMYAQIIASEHKLPCLVSNPYYKMSEFLQTRKGWHTYKSQRKDGKQNIEVTDELIEDFNELEKEERIFCNAEECKQFVWGIFGEKDELAIDREGRNKHEREFLNNYSLSFHFSGGHTPTYDETREHHVPLVARLIMEFVYYRKKTSCR